MFIELTYEQSASIVMGTMMIRSRLSYAVRHVSGIQRTAFGRETKKKPD